MNGSVLRCERNILRPLKSKVNTFKKEIRLYSVIIRNYTVNLNSDKCNLYTRIADNLVKYTPGIVENSESEMEFFFDEIDARSDSDIDSSSDNDSDYEQDFDEKKQRSFQCHSYSKIFDIMPSNSDFLWFDVKSKISDESFAYLSEIYYEFKIVVSKLREMEHLIERGNRFNYRKNAEKTFTENSSTNNEATQKVRKLSEISSIVYFFNELLPESDFSRKTSEMSTNHDETGFPSIQESLKNESIDHYSSYILFTRKLLHSKIPVQQRFYFEFMISELLLLLFSNFKILSPLIPILINFCSSELNLLCKYLKKLYLSGVPLGQFCSVLETEDYSMNFKLYLEYSSLKKFDISVLENKYFLEKISKSYLTLQDSNDSLRSFKNLIKIFEKIISSIPNNKELIESKELFQKALYYILSLIIRMDYGEQYTVLVIDFLNKVVNEMNEREFKSSKIEQVQFLISYNLLNLNLLDSSSQKNIWKLSHDLSTVRFIVRISNERFISKFISNFYMKNKHGLLKVFSKNNLSSIFKFKNLHFQNHVRLLISFFIKLPNSDLHKKDPLNILQNKSTRSKSKKLNPKKRKVKRGGII